MSQLIKAKAAAEMLGVHTNTLRNWTQAGIINELRTPTGQRRYNLDEVQTLRANMEIVRSK